MELPAVILGDRGDDDQPRVRVLPGRIEPRKVLHPAYTAVGAAGTLAMYFSLTTGEWHPVMVMLGWGLLFCWYWVYAVGYRYRRWMMKYFAVVMGGFTAVTLTLVTAARVAAMAVPDNGQLLTRAPQPTLVAVAVLTTASLAAVISHVVYLGRGYRQKTVDGHNGDNQQAS